MKKSIIIGVTILLIFLGIYHYYDNKKTEVYISGRLIGFELQDIKENINNDKIINTSSKSIGTITFIENNSTKFAAFGHSILQNNNTHSLVGNCYQVEFDHIEKATQNETGKIIAKLNKQEQVGSLNTENKYGIYGNLLNSIQDEQLISTENRFNIKKGTAYILLNIDSTGLKKYEVQINQINYFASNQNIKIEVKSEELIKLSGGIVQGMSGAPLIQNGKLIGAINCVNINNPLDAYAIFIDKLL